MRTILFPKRALGLSLLLLGLAHGALAQTPEAIHDGFEAPLSNRLWRIDKLAPEALTLQSERVRAGRQAAKITIRAGDPSPTVSADHTERDELQEHNKFNAREGEAYAYAFSLLIPEDFPIVSTRLVLAQWKHREGKAKPLVGTPGIARRYVDGELSITVQKDEEKTPRFQTRQDIRGKWLDFVFHVRHSRHADGFVRVWMNGDKLLDHQGPNAYSEALGYPAPEASVFYFKMGLYRDDMAEPMTVYLDEYRKRPLTKEEMR